MDTTQTHTGYWIARCSAGCTIRHTDAERSDNLHIGSNKYGYTICQHRMPATYRPIVARETRTECGPRCTGAIGPACDCKCGGENHAGGH